MMYFSPKKNYTYATFAQTEHKRKINFKKPLLFLTCIFALFGIYGGYKVVFHKKETNFLKGLAEEKPDNYKTSRLNQFEPDKEWELFEKAGLVGQPETVAKAALIVNIKDGEVLYNKNSDQTLQIASLTKIMTALTVIEHIELDTKVTISEKAASIGENSMGLTAGESYTVEELLYGLILNSGNDAAYALAEATAGDVETFVKWMNLKAKELGLQNTYFADPSGLDDSTYSTAQDLVRLTRYALKYKNLRKIAETVSHEISKSDERKQILLQNQTNLLTTYPGVKGFKTGYTEKAGLCLVTYAQNDDVELVGVVLNSIDRKGDMVLMLDHAFGKYGISVEHNYKFK